MKIGIKIKRFFHFDGIRKRSVYFLVNHAFAGTNPRFFAMKRKLLNTIGHDVGKGSKVVGPVELQGTFKCGKDCWIGKNMRLNGNGTVILGDNCDIAPEVTFQTGGHEIGEAERRAGKGMVFHQSVGNGTWIGGRVTILNNTHIGNSCVIAACACVTKDIPDNTLAGGVPAKAIRVLQSDK